MGNTAALAVLSALWTQTICLAEEASTPVISVLVYDYAGVPADVSNAGLRETKRILESGGIQVAWVNCLEAPDSLPVERTCREPPGPLMLVLHILTQGATRRRTEPGAAGFAVLPAYGCFGSSAGVFNDRVKQLGATAPEAAVLGHVIAHELGHLLLGTGGHSAGGIMKADWSHQQIILAAQGFLRFDPGERKRILVNMRHRMLAARTQNCQAELTAH